MADLMTGSSAYNTLANQYGNFIVPAMKIKVNGQDVITSMNLQIVELTVTCSLHAAGCTVIKIGGCYDEEQTSFSSDVKDKFKLGTVVSVELGYLSHTELVFKGYVAMLGAEFAEDKLIVVTLMDARRLMMTSGKKQILYDVKNYSDAFSTVIGEYSKLCTSTMDATNDQLENPVSQTSNDYEFITKELARKGKREFFIFADKAYFRQLDSNTSACMTVQYGRELLELKVDHEYLDVKIKVLGYDQMEETSVAYEKQVTSSLDQTSVITTPEFTIADIDADSQEKAQNRAEFIAQQEINRTCTGSGKTIGLPEIVPGRYLEVEEADELVNKKFYITEVKHSIVNHFFTTEFEIGGMTS